MEKIAEAEKSRTVLEAEAEVKKTKQIKSNNKVTCKDYIFGIWKVKQKRVELVADEMESI